MNTTHFDPTSISSVEDIFGARVAARLSAAANDLPHDVSERLRAARVRAVAKRRALALQPATNTVMVNSPSGTLASQGDHLSGWAWLAALLPLLALVAGLMGINVLLDELRINELAEIDAALLTDDLPPAAYADAGFAQFVKLGALQ